MSKTLYLIVIVVDAVANDTLAGVKLLSCGFYLNKSSGTFLTCLHKMNANLLLITKHHIKQCKEIVNILFMAPRMVYCRIINLLWSLLSKMSTMFRSVSYRPCSCTGVTCVLPQILVEI